MSCQKFFVALGIIVLFLSLQIVWLQEEEAKIAHEGGQRISTNHNLQPIRMEEVGVIDILQPMNPVNLDSRKTYDGEWSDANYINSAIDRSKHRKYAILIAPLKSNSLFHNNCPNYGSRINNYQCFKFDITQMRKYLLGRGWTDDYIIFLACKDETETAGEEWWIDGEPTFDNLKKALDAVAFGGTYRFIQSDGNLGPQQHFLPSTINDTVFIELRGDGGRSVDGGPLDSLPGDEADGLDGWFYTCSSINSDQGRRNLWYDDQIANYLNNITCAKLILLVSSCYSGEFLPDCSGPNRLIITSTAEYEVAYTGLYKFYEYISNIAADGFGGSKNNIISLEEAYHYSASIITIQTPQIDDQILGETYLQ